ncbi:MAG: hypothetical protein FWE82_07540, partial [Defluviitaleaceae bacterium]|nr:hypothetical protein [Defluviitaleaceae bacterium]
MFLENKCGRFPENYFKYAFKFKAEAIRETEGEQDSLIRGGLVAQYVLRNVPVAIEPQDLFATFGLTVRNQKECDEYHRAMWSLPWCGGTYIHFAPDYAALIKKGVKGLLAEISAKEKDGNNLSFYTSAKTTLAAVLEYAERFRLEAERLIAETTDEARRFELTRMRDALARVPFEPAQTLYEAMQSISLFHSCVGIVESNGISLGRMDYVLGEFYEADLAAGRITKDDAAEWIQCMMLRSEFMSGQGDSLILAGSRPNGAPFWNDITYFILGGVRALRQRGPQIWFRYTDGLPRDLLRECFVCLREGTSHPGFFNDRVSVAALEKAGCTHEHALDYVSCQCIEISPAGCSHTLCGHGYHNLAKPIELLINGGKHMVDETNDFSAWPDYTLPEDASLEFNTFENFLDTYEKYLRALLRAVVARSNKRMESPPPIVTTLCATVVRDCIARGRSLMEGGAVYNQVFPNFTSLVTAADSLAAIEQCVFKDKFITMEELACACRENFEGREDVRLYLLNRCPKYGNDNPAADRLAKFIYDVVADELFKHKNIYGETFAPQYFALHASGTHAFSMAATPDGRRHGEAPSGTLGGDLGRELNGLTALFNSVTSFDHSMSSGGLNVNLRLNATILTTEEDLDKMVDLL